MVYESFVTIGGVVFVPALKKPMAIVNVIDLSRLVFIIWLVNYVPNNLLVIRDQRTTPETKAYYATVE